MDPLTCTCCRYPSGDSVSRRTVWQGVLIATLVAAILIGLWWLVLVGHRLKKRLLAVSAWKSCCSASSIKEVSPLHQKAQELYTEGRLERYEWVLGNIAFFMTPFIVFAASWSCAWSFMMDDITGLAVGAYTNCGIQGAAVSVVAMFFTQWKHCLSVRVADLILCAIYISFAFSAAFSTTNYLYTCAARSALMSQVMMAVAIADPKIIWLPELVSFVIQVVAVFNNPRLVDNWDQHLINRLVCTAYVFGVCNFCRKWFKEKALALAREMEAAGDEAHMESLLSLMCDATVALNADFSFRKESPKFVGMLLRNPKSSIVGRNFTDYIAHDDVETFLNFAKGRTRGHQEASLVHISLLDCLGNRVRAQVFHTCMQDPIENVARHLLGVVEDGKHQADSVAELSSQVRHQSRTPPRTDSPTPGETAEPSESGRSGQSALSTSSGGSQRSRSVRGKRYVAVSSRPPFSVLQVSLGVRSMWDIDFTPLIGHPFPSWIKDQDKSEAFTEFLTMGLEEASRTEEDVTGEFGLVHVHPGIQGQPAPRCSTQRVMVVAIVPSGRLELSPDTSAEPIYVELRRVRTASIRGPSRQEGDEVPDEAMPQPLRLDSSRQLTRQPRTLSS